MIIAMETAIASALGAIVEVEPTPAEIVAKRNEKGWLRGRKNGTGEDAQTWIGFKPVLTGDYNAKRKLLAWYKRSLGLSPKHSFVTGKIPT